MEPFILTPIKVSKVTVMPCNVWGIICICVFTYLVECQTLLQKAGNTITPIKNIRVIYFFVIWTSTKKLSGVITYALWCLL